MKLYSLIPACYRFIPCTELGTYVHSEFNSKLETAPSAAQDEHRAPPEVDQNVAPGHAGTLLVGTIAAILTGCQADEGGPQRSDQLPEAFRAFREARSDFSLISARRRIAAAQHAAVATPLPSATELMDWAEEAYSAFFPGTAPDQQEAPFVYRHYQSTGNYLGVADGEVYILARIFHEQ